MIVGQRGRKQQEEWRVHDAEAFDLRNFEDRTHLKPFESHAKERNQAWPNWWTMNGDFLTSIASKLYAQVCFSNATASCFRLFQAISPDSLPASEYFSCIRFPCGDQASKPFSNYFKAILKHTVSHSLYGGSMQNSIFLFKVALDLEDKKQFEETQ